MPRLPGEAPSVKLYRGKDCHLCDVARGILLSLQRVIPFHLQQVQVEGDPELERRFLLEIPVVEVAGEVVSTGQVDVDAIRGALNRARIESTRRSALGGASPAPGASQPDRTPMTEPD
jgi:membrane protein YdbS with pleckstrin-like domain